MSWHSINIQDVYCAKRTFCIHMYLVQQGLRMIVLSISLPVAIQNRRYLPIVLYAEL